jgi:hypothetical protein
MVWKSHWDRGHPSGLQLLLSGRSKGCTQLFANDQLQA